MDYVKNLQDINLLDSEGKPVSYASFKNRTTILKYGKGRKQLKIVFAGIPQKNLFGFYVYTDTDPNVLKEAYEMLKQISRGDMTPIEDKDVQWGNCGMPLAYGNLRKI